jgi:hypothetical protein
MAFDVYRLIPLSFVVRKDSIDKTISHNRIMDKFVEGGMEIV